MKRSFRGKKGFTLTELIFVAMISAMVIGAIISTWLFTYRAWTVESGRTSIRIDLMKALETMKADMRLSSLTYMSFYPDGGEPYTAVSLPVAEVDVDGFYTLNAQGEIDWDETVIYHLFTDDDGNVTLRRTVYDPRDNTLTDEERYNQLAAVAGNGIGGDGSTTELEFLENIDTFGISSLAPIIDFYEDSDTPVRVGKIVFGWAKLDAGDHTVRFEITGKNDDSDGYDIGIDTIMIEPSGSVREVEYYNSSFAPVGSLTLNGGTASRVHDTAWSNDNYLEFDATGIDDYMEIEDHYDLWRESAFENCSLNNTESTGDEDRVSLDIPEEDEDGQITWFAYGQAGDSQQEGRDGTLPGGVTPPVTIRTVVLQDAIDQEGDLVRVSFKSSAGEDLIIDRAYITKRDGTSGANGLANQDTTGLEVHEYHRHQQLFFSGASGNTSASKTITAGSTVWSLWTAFPLRTDSDYLVSLYISDTDSDECTYWSGSGSTNTYYLVGAEYSTRAGVPDWSDVTPSTDSNMYITANIDVWQTTGSIESQIFDTTLTDPGYNTITWSEEKPAGTSIDVKARSSSDEYMAGATDWGVISWSAIDGTERYVQFYSEMSTAPYWESGASSLGYEAYVDDQVDNYPVYGFPESGGEAYITGMYSCWVDDIEIDWPGEERICTITGYIARKDDYGQARVVVDGEALMKILSVHVIVSKDIEDGTVTEENYLEIQPRNTGK